MGTGEYSLHYTAAVRAKIIDFVTLIPLRLTNIVAEKKVYSDIVKPDFNPVSTSFLKKGDLNYCDGITHWRSPAPREARCQVQRLVRPRESSNRIRKRGPTTVPRSGKTEGCC